LSGPSLLRQRPMTRTILFSLGALLWAADAGAANTARLVYLRGQGTEACPDERALEDAVAARLGYDPFSTWAVDTLFVELEKDSTGWNARVKLVTRENVVRGARTLHASACSALIPTLGLTISLAIDPMSGTRNATDPPEGPPKERPVEPVPAEP